MVLLKKTFLFSISIIITIAFMYIESYTSMFINLPAFLLITLIPLPIMLATYGKKSLLFCKEKGKVKNAIIDQWSHMLFATACMTFIMGFIQILVVIEDPMSIGPPLAVSLLTVFYASLIKLFLLEPFRDVEVFK